MNRRRMLRFAIGVGMSAGASPLWAQTAVVGLRRVGVLAPSTRAKEEVILKPFFDEVTTDRTRLALAATTLGLTVVVVEMSSAGELDAAVAKLFGQDVDVIYASSTITDNLRGRLIELANRRRLPVVGGGARMAEAGALFTYNSSLPDKLRRSAHLVDKVLKGAKPADLPVEQPTKFELVINLKTARSLGHTIPQSVLLRADEVIQ